MTSEADLQIQVADYLRLQYPDVMFHSDFGSGIKLTPGQAVKQKRQNGGRRAWPDMVIAESRCLRCMFCHNDITIPCIRPNFIEDECDGVNRYHGLYLELKKEGTRMKKKNGDWVNDHIAEQAEILERLRQRGYCAEFAVGFDEAKKMIDEYLGGK